MHACRLNFNFKILLHVLLCCVPTMCCICNIRKCCMRHATSTMDSLTEHLTMDRPCNICNMLHMLRVLLQHCCMLQTHATKLYTQPLQSVRYDLRNIESIKKYWVNIFQLTQIFLFYWIKNVIYVYRTISLKSLKKSDGSYSIVITFF